MSPIQRVDQNQRRSRGIVWHDLVFLAGQTATDLNGDIREQALEAFAKVDDMLARSNSEKTRVLSVTIWLSDMADYDGFNEIWDRWIVNGQSPVRACAKVEMHDPRVKVELVVTAATSE